MLPLQANDFDKRKEVCMDLLPDVVLLASPGDQWPKIIESQIEEFPKELISLGIKVVPQLPSGDKYC